MFIYEKNVKPHFEYDGSFDVIIEIYTWGNWDIIR